MKTIVLALMLLTLGLLPAPAAADCPPEGWLGGGALEQQACAAVLHAEEVQDEAIRVFIALVTGVCATSPPACLPNAGSIVDFLAELAVWIVEIAMDAGNLIADSLLRLIDDVSGFLQPLVHLIGDLLDAFVEAVTVFINITLSAICNLAEQEDCPQLPP